MAAAASSSSTTKSSSLSQRPDGRTHSTLRPLSSSLAVIKRADGSAKFTAGRTSVVAAVYGPIASRIEARMHMSRASVTCVFPRNKQTSGVNDSRSSREMEEFVANSVSTCISLEEYPRTIIEIVIEILTADGGVLSTAVNAAVLALMDAGIHLTSLPIATTCLITYIPDAKSELIKLDPTNEEEQLEDASIIVLVTDSVQKDGVIASTVHGCLKTQTYLACIEAASRASAAVIGFIRIAIEQKLNREHATLWAK